MFTPTNPPVRAQQFKQGEASEHNRFRSINIAKVQNGFVIYADRYNPGEPYNSQSNQYIAKNGSEVLTLINELIEKDSLTVV